MDVRTIRRVLAESGSGKPYDDVSRDANELRNWALGLCRRYNYGYLQTGKCDTQLLEELLGRVGENTTILPNIRVEFGKNVVVGKNFFANFDCFFMDCAPITFGDDVKIGPKCGFYTSNHVEDPLGRQIGYCEAHPIKVSNNVWFGAQCVVLGNVTIGDNSIIGAGSVDTRDVPANVIVAGNPAKVIRPLKTDERYSEIKNIKNTSYQY